MNPIRYMAIGALFAGGFFATQQCSAVDWKIATDSEPTLWSATIWHATWRQVPMCASTSCKRRVLRPTSNCCAMTAA